MKRLFAVFLSTAAICAFVSATAVVAQETITGAPQGEEPITAAPPSYEPGGASDSALDEIGAAIKGGWADTTQPDTGRNVTSDPEGSQRVFEYRGVP